MGGGFLGGVADTLRPLFGSFPNPGPMGLRGSPFGNPSASPFGNAASSPFGGATSPFGQPFGSPFGAPLGAPSGLPGLGQPSPAEPRLMLLQRENARAGAMAGLSAAALGSTPAFAGASGPASHPFAPTGSAGSGVISDIESLIANRTPQIGPVNQAGARTAIGAIAPDITQSTASASPLMTALAAPAHAALDLMLRSQGMPRSPLQLTAGTPRALTPTMTRRNRPQGPAPVFDVGPPTTRAIDGDAMLRGLQFDPNGPTQAELVGGVLPFQKSALAVIAALHAEAWTAYLFPTTFRQPDGPADAYKHALWNFLMTRWLGPHVAKQAGDAHEVSDPNPLGARLMDLFDNNIGRGLALDPALRDKGLRWDLREAPFHIYQALLNGELQTEPFKTKSGRSPR
jgi:hypothetical protein